MFNTQNINVKYLGTLCVVLCFTHFCTLERKDHSTVNTAQMNTVNVLLSLLVPTEIQSSVKPSVK